MTAKSAVINLWSLVTFLALPLLCVRFDLWHEVLIFWAAITVLMFIVPPFGWHRPHPYSDKVWNRRGPKEY
ncbi:unnamed protein product [Heterosigma akashiwo]